MTFVSGSRPRFQYFDAQLGLLAWTSLRVLDFGGNAAGLLRDSTCLIRPENYWCIDVSRDALALGKTWCPDAHFAFYDRFNPVFNPNGQADLPIPCLGTFDVILAFSVMTHLPIDELDAVDRVATNASSKRSICVHLSRSELSASSRTPTNLEHRLRAVVPTPEYPECVAVIDGTLHDARSFPARAVQYDVLHSCEFVRRLFPDALIKSPVYHERQHCAILTAA
jgi:hypothetical protein